MPHVQPPSETVPQKSYERKFSFLQRLFKVLSSPEEGMKDVTLAPHYCEIFGTLAIHVFVLLLLVLLHVLFPYPSTPLTIAMSLLLLPPLAFVVVALMFVALSKILFWGLTSAIIVGFIFSYGLTVAVWLIKSIVAKIACSRGGSWSFKSTSSTVAYTFLVETVLSVVMVAILSLLIPFITIDIAGLGLTQLIWCWLAVSLVGIVWKSYLGGFGANFGTEGKCSRKMGFAVFFCLNLVGSLALFIILGLA